MQLAIPKAPRKVRFVQVPGAVGRLGLAVVLGALGVLALAAGARWVSNQVSAERSFLGRAAEISGTVYEVRMPPVAKREEEDAYLTVLYAFGEKQYSATGIPARALDAEKLGHGAKVALLVDPKDPDHPREQSYAEDRARAVDLLPYGATAGAILALVGIAFELVRTYRAEVEPLRKGALVWLTPKGELPKTKREAVFKASYYRDDVKYEVRARARPGRAPVRNGEKILAALVPKKPSWVRVIDEDLARDLKWFA